MVTGEAALGSVDVRSPLGQDEATQPGQAFGRDNMRRWEEATKRNVYVTNDDFAHTVRFHLGEDYGAVHGDLVDYGSVVPTDLEEAVAHGDYRLNLPRIDWYGAIGDRDDRVVHDHSTTTSGDLVYGSRVVSRLARTGGLREGYAFHYLSNHCGDTGHNCPVICNYETARVLRSFEDFPNGEEIAARLEEPSFSRNWTAAQFLTEVQGGSDVGANDTLAWQANDGSWRIRGEKWFCSNANAEVQVVSARFDATREGTRGLAMFLVPARKPDGTRNDFTLRRLKEKLGTRALASAEIDYHDAYAESLGPVEDGFRNLMTLVIHHSRLALPLAMAGMLSRAYQLARSYADTRHAFGKTIIEYPLVQDNLARVKTDLLAGTAATFAVIALQDELDTGEETRDERRAFCRLMANVNKSVWSTRILARIQDAAETLAGNGMIETTSSMPRLLRDAMIVEKWEGSQNTIRMQVLRDIHRSEHGEIFLDVMAEIAGDIGSVGPEREALDSALAECRRLLATLHDAPHALQTLQMQQILPQLANTYAYWALVREGQDQESAGTGRKLAAAELFRRMYLTDEPDVWDETYLELIARITDVGTPT
jgi:acyl-CoA dehydrogenase